MQRRRLAELDKTATTTKAALPGSVNHFVKGFTMNSKLFPTIATIAIAMSAALASTAMAVEATQFEPEPSVRSRADVKAELAASRNAGVVQYGEATVFVDQPSSTSRALARSDDHAAPVKVVLIGEATQFIDQPGTRSRDDVRAETLAGISASRVRK